MALGTEDTFVFAAYNEQLRHFHRTSDSPWRGNRINGVFVPENLGDWFYRQIRDWSDSLPNGAACVHVFRKTSLQYARCGEDLNRQIAADARLGEDVMMTNYVKESDPEMREKSNRTFRRIRASLTTEVANRYGYALSEVEVLRERHQCAVQAGDWELAARLAAEIAMKLREGGTL